MLKNQRLSFYLAAVAMVLAVISLLLFFHTNATISYAVGEGGIVIVCTVLAILLCGCSLFLQARGAGEFLLTVLRLLTLGLLMVAFTIVLSDRALVAGGLFTWNNLDNYAWDAFYTGIACMVFQLLTVLVLIVSSFMRQDTKR